MKPVETHDPDVMEWRGGGGCLLLFGLPFLAAGCFIMSLPFTGIEVKGNMPKWMMVPFGGVFAAIGAAIAFGRRGVIVDRARRQVRTWWGLLVALGGSERDLGEFTGVTLKSEIRKSKNSSYTVYPVRLVGGGEPVRIGEPRVYEASRRAAEALAKFTGLPVEDSTSGSVVRREADALDESLRERARRTGGTFKIPPPPDVMRTGVSLQGDATVLDIPPAGFHPFFFVMLAFSLVIPAFVGFFMLRPALGGGSDDPFRWVFIGVLLCFMAAPVVTIAVLVRNAANRRWTVTVSPSEVKVEARGGFPGRTTVLSADEIEEIEVRALPEGGAQLAAMRPGPGGGILLKSDRATVSFGGHLRKEELDHLKVVIASVIAG